LHFFSFSVDFLIKKGQAITDPIPYYAFAEEMYSIVLRAHLNTGHGERDKMLKEVNKKYATLPKYEYCRYRKILRNTGNTSIADTGKYW
jgi:hypothetical protein